MKDFATYYEILEVKETVDLGGIKKAYRSKALKYHPDRVPEHLKKRSEEMFKQISEAYEVLSDPEKRKQYDQGLKNLKNGSSFDQANSPEGPILEVDKTRFEFKNLAPNTIVTDFIIVSNEGGGRLTGAARSVYGWVTLSKTVIDTGYSQGINITVDTSILLANQKYRDEIEIQTNGGNQTVYVDISTAPLTNMDTLILLARSIVSKRWFMPLFYTIIVFEAVVFLLLGERISNYFGSHKEGMQTSGSEILQPASERLNERTSQEYSNLPKDKTVVNEIVIREGGSSETFPVAKDIKEAERTFLGQKAGYPKKEIINDEIVNETGIFYPKTGAYYPIQRARYPEFYRKCDLNHDGVVMLSELGKLQRKFNKITAKYPEGDIDSIVKEFTR